MSNQIEVRLEARCAGIIKADIADGRGVRVGVFLSGCPHHCPGCFNLEAQDYNYGKPFGVKVFNDIQEALSKDYVKGVTLLGGEPLVDCNLGVAWEIIRMAKSLHKDVWVYSGYTWEQLMERLHDKESLRSIPLYYILAQTNVLVDGPFILGLKDTSLPFCGSSNQRIIDVQRSFKEGKIVLYDLNQKG